MAPQPAPSAPKGKINFEPVESAAEARRILSDCARSIATAQLFTRKQKSVLVCRFIRLDDGALELGFRPDQPELLKPFLDELSATGSPDLFVNVVNDRVKVFFRSPIKGLKEGRLVLAMPPGIFRVQRREHIRFKIPQTHTLRVDVVSPLDFDTVHHPKVIDISAGGLAFSVKKEQADLFSSGLELSDLRFTLNRRLILVQAVIRHARPVLIDGEEMVVIGVLFNPIRPEDQKWINDYVRAQNRAMLAKML